MSFSAPTEEKKLLIDIFLDFLIKEKRATKAITMKKAAMVKNKSPVFANEVELEVIVFPVSDTLAFVLTNSTEKSNPKSMIIPFYWKLNNNIV